MYNLAGHARDLEFYMTCVCKVLEAERVVTFRFQKNNSHCCVNNFKRKKVA